LIRSVVATISTVGEGAVGAAVRAWTPLVR